MSILKQILKGHIFRKKLLLLSLFGMLIVFASSSVSTLRAQKQEEKQAASGTQKGEGSLSGFANINWGTKFNDVREEFRDLASSEDAEEKTEILNLKRNEFILVRHNDTIYRYTFYKTPYAVALLKDKELEAKKYDEEEEGEFFHVQLRFPPVEAALMKAKIEEKYGKHQGASSIDKKGFGALIWQLEGGFIFLWYEGYGGRSFVRRVDYLSAQHAKKVAEEYKDYFTAQEKLILQKIKLD